MMIVGKIAQLVRRYWILPLTGFNLLILVLSIAFGEVFYYVFAGFLAVYLGLVWKWRHSRGYTLFGSKAKSVRERANTVEG